MKKEISFSIILLITFSLALSNSINVISSEKQTDNISRKNTINTITTGIHVHNDAELQALAVSGAGTPGDPWIIRDLVIDTPDIVALRIEDTTEYFDIRNCTVTARWGIYLDNITDNTAWIENNTVVNCDSTGIYLTKANGTWIVDNILINNMRGMEIYYSYVTFIQNNYCANYDSGIFIRHSPYASLTGNELFGDGIEVDFDNLEDMMTLVESGNTVNGKMFLLLKNAANAAYSGDYGQIIAMNCSQIAFEDQATINVDIGIAIYYSSLVQILDSVFSGSDSGIYLVESSDTYVTSCYFHDISDGVHIDYSNYTTIQYNHFEMYYSAIFGNYPDNLLITMNTFYDGEDTGIYLDTCKYLTIYNNDFHNNSYGALYIYDTLHAQIYRNNFTQNGADSGYQAYDDLGTDVYFYDPVGLIGNYWDDHNPLDDNYTVAGDPGNIDLYPLTSPIILVPEFDLIQLGFWGLLVSILASFVALQRFRKNKK